MFWWAEFRKIKGGIKLHTLDDVKTSIPTFVHITNASVHDINVLDIVPYEAGGYYIVDHGYVDFKRLHNINNRKAYFVTRAKSNFRFQRMYSRKTKKRMGILSDQIGKLEGFYILKD